MVGVHTSGLPLVPLPPAAPALGVPGSDPHTHHSRPLPLSSASVHHCPHLSQDSGGLQSLGDDVLALGPAVGVGNRQTSRAWESHSNSSPTFVSS